jgi:hypothetical protein
VADVFVSYKRENQDAVQPIVRGLRGAGLSVWWDQDIAPDAPWEATIESELGKAKVVLVAWSRAAVASENVKAEARRARTQGKLIQTFVEGCDPPLFFGERQGVDLTRWDGGAGDNRFQAIVSAAKAILAGKRPPQGVGYAPRKQNMWPRFAAAAALAFVLAIGLNVVGSRDRVCSASALTKICAALGLGALGAIDRLRSRDGSGSAEGRQRFHTVRRPRRFLDCVCCAAGGSWRCVVRDAQFGCMFCRTRASRAHVGDSAGERRRRVSVFHNERRATWRPHPSAQPSGPQRRRHHLRDLGSLEAAAAARSLGRICERGVSSATRIGGCLLPWINNSKQSVIRGQGLTRVT